MSATDSPNPSSLKSLKPAPPHRGFLLLLSIVVLLLVMAASLMLGAKAIPFSVVWQSLLGEHNSADSILILESRLPRTLIGVLAGAALGLSGAVIQALTRNPLADPGILGVNAGASFAVVIGITVFGVQAIHGYMISAFIGAMVTTLVVYWVGTLGGGAGKSPAPHTFWRGYRRGVTGDYHRHITDSSAGLRQSALLASRFSGYSQYVGGDGGSTSNCYRLRDSLAAGSPTQCHAYGGRFGRRHWRAHCTNPILGGSHRDLTLWRCYRRRRPYRLCWPDGTAYCSLDCRAESMLDSTFHTGNDAYSVISL